LTDKKGSALFISTPSGFNHFYDLFNLENTDLDYKSFHFTTYDNPFIDVSEINKAQIELPENRFAQEYLADFRKTEGLVYNEFDRHKHTFDSLEGINKIDTLVGIDWGYTNPTAVLLIYKDYDRTYWVVSEWYRKGKTTEEVIEYVKTLGANIFYPDPAEPDRISQMRRHGLNVREVNKDVVKGVDAVRTLLKNGKLKIHKSCLQLINEFETYAYQDKKVGKNDSEEPIKENDHGLDALRYTVFMQEPVERKTVKQFIPKLTHYSERLR
jgi:PBSX family phage terminase large subunit